MFYFKSNYNARTKTVIITTVVACFLLLIPAQAQSPIEKAKQVKKDISSMREDLSKAFNEYEEGAETLKKIDNRLFINTKKLEDTKIELKKNQKLLSSRINNMYTYGDATILDIVFKARSFNEMLVNVKFIIRISQKDASIIRKVERLQKEAKQTQKQLVADQNHQKRLVASLKKNKDLINIKLGKAKKMLVGLEKEIEELRKPKPLPPPVIHQITPPNSPPANPGGGGTYAFPVGQPYSYSNDWGAPRGGGRRSHRGNDILAPMGTPAYAVIGGTVSNTSGGNSGLWQILHGDDGNAYWYMHQKSFAASGRVSTGQVIGYVGNSGNARGGPAHVHFELHPGGGGAVNPFFFLSSIG